MNTTTVRRALVALLLALAVGASVAPQAAQVLSAAQETEVLQAGSRGGMSRVGRESSSAAPEVLMASSKGGLARSGRESS